MDIQTGNTVTIRRGKLAGTQGEVIAINDNEAVLKLAGGTFSTQAVTNIKAPEVPTINADDLAAIISTEGSTFANPQVFDSLVHAIDAKLPGFASRVSLPTPAVTDPERDNDPGSNA